MTQHEQADHRAVLGDIYDDLQLYRKADLDVEQTVQAVLIAGRRTCANPPALADLVRALWTWREAQVAEEEKKADPPPPTEQLPHPWRNKPEH